LPARLSFGVQTISPRTTTLYNLVFSHQRLGGKRINKQKDNLQQNLDRLSSQLNLCFLIIAATLTAFMRLSSRITGILKDFSLFARLPDEEIADRMTVIILLFLIALGFLLVPKLAKFSTNPRWANGISVATLLLLITTVSWRWGDPTFDQYNEVLWYGWGDKFAIAILILGVGLTITTHSGLSNAKKLFSTSAIQGLNLASAVLLVVYYLPSVIQPFKGIIDTYHSRYILNDLLIFSTGKMPFTEITPQYIGLLGLPLRLLAFLPGEAVVNASLIWVNALVVFEIFLIVLIAKKALATKYWATAAIAVIATMFVKVQPNMRSWGSLAQHMNLIPGRTVLPITLLFIVSHVAVVKDGQSRKAATFFLGFLSAITTVNNVEFGAPAAIATVIILVGLKVSQIVSKAQLFAFISGFISALLGIALIYSLNGSQLTVDSWLVMIRAHGVDGFMNLAMPFFGLWTFFYAVLGASAIIGANKIFREYKSEKFVSEDLRAAILLAFGGLWGSATLFYFSGRSLVPEIVVFLIPLTLCIIGYISLVKADLSKSDNSTDLKATTFSFLRAPLFCLILIPLVSITQAPNPGFEWLRMAGSGERWSSRALKQLPKYEEMIEIVTSDQSKKFIYMGNDGPAFEMMSGVENGLGIILLQDLLIGEDLTEVGCTPALNSGADFALVPKSDWVNPPNRIPCAGFDLQPVNPDSEFLIYAIPSKVSS
jgi:hypothetical protein